MGGRYSPRWPDGKKHVRDVYAPTEEECEEKLAVMIVEMNAERAAWREAHKAAVAVDGGITNLANICQGDISHLVPLKNERTKSTC